jgi:hypothetical protein
MAEAGASWAVIADALSRGQIACQTKWRELRSPEERARTRVAKLAAINAASTTAAPRAPRRDSRAAEIIVARRAPQRPPQVGAAPRSLTALVLGDPPPGRSALDQLAARGPLR